VAETTIGNSIYIYKDQNLPVSGKNKTGPTKPNKDA